MTPSPRPRPQFEGKLKACRAGSSGGVGSHHSIELLRLAPGKTWHTQPLWVADIQHWHVVLGLGKPKAKPLTVPGFPTGAGVGGKRRGGQGRREKGLGQVSWKATVDECLEAKTMRALLPCHVCSESDGWFGGGPFPALFPWS